MRASGSLRLTRDRIPLGSRPKGERQEREYHDRDVLASGRGAGTPRRVPKMRPFRPCRDVVSSVRPAEPARATARTGQMVGPRRS